jgi:uncharacterized protein (DUF1684 family)
LAYFDPDPELVFEVGVTPGDDTAVTIATSDGSERVYRRAGSVDVEVDGTPVRLTLFDTGLPGYFLPFRDSTSGTTSYGAGRYLDVHEAHNGIVTIDFNLAYSPFCAYSDAYACALPPHENWLDVAIAAGEASFEPARGPADGSSGIDREPATKRPIDSV